MGHLFFPLFMYIIFACELFCKLISRESSRIVAGNSLVRRNLLEIVWLEIVGIQKVQKFYNFKTF